jgi:hypothetical protein
VASSAIGTRNLYDFINDNPAIDFEPSDYVNDPAIIARNNKMVSLSVPMAMDLTDRLPQTPSILTIFPASPGWWILPGARCCQKAANPS